LRDLDPKLLLADLAVPLVGDQLVQPDTLHNGVLLLLCDVKLAGHVLVSVGDQDILIASDYLLAQDALVDPLSRVNLSQVIVNEPCLNDVRLDLEGKALVLVYNSTSIHDDLIMQFLVSAALRDVEV